jgi:threonine/homoserine/homoserine lactone efflux protein
MWFLTNLLNPKIAVFYTSVLPSLVPHGASPMTGVVLIGFGLRLAAETR